MLRATCGHSNGEGKQQKQVEESDHADWHGDDERNSSNEARRENEEKLKRAKQNCMTNLGKERNQQTMIASAMDILERWIKADGTGNI